MTQFQEARPRILYLVTEDWYFLSHRLPIARAARDAGFEVSVATRVRRCEERIRSEGITPIPIDLRRGEIGPIRDFVAVFSLRRLFKRLRPQIVHNVGMKPVVLGTMAGHLSRVGGLVNALAGLGYVFTGEDRKAAVLRPLVKFLFKLLFQGRRVSIIVQNSSDKDALEKIGVSADKIFLIAGSGVDIDAFPPLPEADGPVTVVMVSRMLKPKGVEELVKAARLVREKRPDIRIRLIGAPDPENPATVEEESLIAWSREGNVEWRGQVSAEEIPSVWKQAHIGVLPSYYGEGIPKSLLEAGACGRPLIATDIPGCRDVVIPGETGLIVPPRDPHALAQAILRLAEDGALRARLGKAARERVEQHFSVEKVVKETLALYRSILAPG